MGIRLDWESDSVSSGKGSSYVAKEDPERRRARARARARFLLIFLGGLFACAVFLFPVAWMVVTSFKMPRDIFTTPARELGVKIADARFVSVCTQDGANALTRAAPGFAARIHLIRHGIRLARFPLFEGTRPARDGKSADDPVRLLSVGRAVEKKGYDGLLRSLALLPRDLAWSFDHIGGGENVVALKAQAVALGLEGRIRFHGAQDSTKVLEAMRAADLFVLFARIARDGDRDGIPNVIVEAASQALPVAATRVGGIGEAVREGETGLLCEEGDEAGFARIMAQLIAEPNLRAQLGTKAQENIPRDFSFDAGLARLRALFEGVA